MTLLSALILALAARPDVPPPEQGDIPWLRLDQAKCVSSKTGKPILVYIACDPTTGRLG